MGGASGQRIVSSAEDWLRQQEKKVMREERRPRVTNASDLLGPGIGPRAVEISDWNGDETEFNGYFFTRPGALHAPDTTSWWIGHSMIQKEGFGLQTVWDYRGVSNPPTQRTRRISLVGGVRVFSAWA